MACFFVCISFILAVTVICLSILFFSLFTTSREKYWGYTPFMQPSLCNMVSYGCSYLYGYHLFNLMYTKINSMKLITSIWFPLLLLIWKKKSNLKKKKNTNSIIKHSHLFHSFYVDAYHTCRFLCNSFQLVV